MLKEFKSLLNLMADTKDVHDVWSIQALALAAIFQFNLRFQGKFEFKDGLYYSLNEYLDFLSTKGLYTSLDSNLAVIQLSRRLGTTTLASLIAHYLKAQMINWGGVVVPNLYTKNYINLNSKGFIPQEDVLIEYDFIANPSKVYVFDSPSLETVDLIKAQGLHAIVFLPPSVANYNYLKASSGHIKLMVDDNFISKTLKDRRWNNGSGFVVNSESGYFINDVV